MAEGLRRIVVDPNVLISAAITPAGSSARIVRLIDAGAIIPIVSPQLLTELTQVLRRPRFRQYLDNEAVIAFISELEHLAEWADDPEDPPMVSDDPADDYLIALTRSARADALVSGDPDVTDLDLSDIRVLSPRGLLDAFDVADQSASGGNDSG